MAIVALPDAACLGVVALRQGFVISLEDITLPAQQIEGNTILSRVGSAPTLVVGSAFILHNALPGGESMMAFWYPFAVLFEALLS